MRNFWRRRRRRNTSSRHTMLPAIEPATRMICLELATSAVMRAPSLSLRGGVGEGGWGGDTGGGGGGRGGNFGSETATTSCVGLMTRRVESCAATRSAVRLLERACASVLLLDCTTTVIRASTVTSNEAVAVTFIGSCRGAVESVIPEIMRTTRTSA